MGRVPDRCRDTAARLACEIILLIHGLNVLTGRQRTTGPHIHHMHAVKPVVCQVVSAGAIRSLQHVRRKQALVRGAVSAEHKGGRPGGSSG